MDVHLKGQYVGFEIEIQSQSFNIYNIDVVIIQTQKYLFIYSILHDWINKLSSENKVPRAVFEARQVAGSATYKQSTTV